MISIMGVIELCIIGPDRWGLVVILWEYSDRFVIVLYCFCLELYGLFSF